MYVSRVPLQLAEKRGKKPRGRAMGLAHYLGLAVVAVVALGGAHMLLQTAGLLLRRKRSDGQTAHRHVPHLKVVHARRPTEEMWF
jgi:hypothetical protein